MKSFWFNYGYDIAEALCLPALVVLLAILIYWGMK